MGPHWTLLLFGGAARAGDLPVDTHDGYVATLGTGDVLRPLDWARPDGR
jgi:hypothetical protein